MLKISHGLIALLEIAATNVIQARHGSRKGMVVHDCRHRLYSLGSSWCRCSGRSGRVRHSVRCRLLPCLWTLTSCITWIRNIWSAGNVIGLVWVGHPAIQAIAVQECRIHMEPLM